MPAKTSSRIDPWAALDALMKTEPEPTGPEWFTVDQYTARYGGSRGHNYQKLIRDRRLEQWKGTGASTKRVTLKFRVKP